MNFFEQYGLKEVANVTFYDIESNIPVLFLDSLKVSTIEQTAENVDARGGWGNPALVSWDYNKDVNLTLEDALFSPMSLKVMMGAKNYIAGAISTPYPEGKITIDVNQEVTLGSTGIGYVDYPASKAATARAPYFFDEETGAFVKDGITIASDPTEVDTENGKETKYKITIASKANKSLRVFYQTEIDGDNGNAMVITIDAATFGGTYKIVGDTLVRSRETGKDEAFQFVINKAKVNSEITFTMEAEGDPATFNMPIRVLKDAEGNMFKMIKYSLPTKSM